MNTLSQEHTYQKTDSTIRLNELIVNAYQLNSRHHQLPGSISLLTTEEMERGDGNSFAQALHAMPGIYMHSGTYATSRIVIRGVGSRTPYNTNRIKAYLNDIPITSSDGISTPEDIDLTGIARMEVIKGPASALYGSGLGGNINLFAMSYWRPAPAWNISLGGAVNSIRYRLTDLFPENGDQSGRRHFPAIFSPRLGINYAPSPRLALFASAGHGFSMPSPEETLLPEGEINRDLQPEQGMQYETGLRLNLFEGVTRMEATLYRIDLRNLLVTKRITEDIFTGINAGRTRHSGLELMLQQQLFRLRSFPGSLQLNASYTLSDNQFIDFEEEGISYNGKQLPGIPSEMAQVTLLWQPTKSWMLELQMQQVGKQFIDDANSLENDAYLLTGLKASRLILLGIAGSVELYTGINNLTNSHYASMLTVNAVAFGNSEPRYYYPGMPRHFYTGIRWSF